MTKTTGDEFTACLARLYITGGYSDLTITCGEIAYQVHKSVVCSRSGFFRRAERSPRATATEKDTIDLPADVPEVIVLLIQYLYEGKYTLAVTQHERWIEAITTPVVTSTDQSGYNHSFPHTCTDLCDFEDSSVTEVCRQIVCVHHLCGLDCSSDCKDFICKYCCAADETAEGNATQLIFHAKMYEIGEKYDVVGLKDYARSKFNEACAKFWDSESFAVAADYAYSTTPEDDKGLRTVVIKTILAHINILDKPSIEALVNEYGSLGYELLKAKAKAIGWKRAKH